jgi:hypothetical protein
MLLLMGYASYQESVYDVLDVCLLLKHDMELNYINKLKDQMYFQRELLPSNTSFLSYLQACTKSNTIDKVITPRVYESCDCVVSNRC